MRCRLDYKKLMPDNIKFYICLLLAIFQTGFGHPLSNWLKYFFLAIGFKAEQSVTLWLGFIFTVWCMVLGNLWLGAKNIKKDKVLRKPGMTWREIENEIGSQLTPYVQELREKVIK